MGETWSDEGKVHEYVGRVSRLAARRAGEVELVEALQAPERPGSTPSHGVSRA